MNYDTYRHELATWKATKTATASYTLQGNVSATSVTKLGSCRKFDDYEYETEEMRQSADYRPMVFSD